MSQLQPWQTHPLVSWALIKK